MITYQNQPVESFLLARYIADKFQTCPFCRAPIATSAYMPRHIRAYCHVADHTLSAAFTNFSNQIKQERSVDLRKISPEDRVFNTIESFVSWEFCEDSDRRKQVQYVVQLADGERITVKNADLARSRVGHNLEKKAKRLRDRKAIPFVATNQCANNQNHCKRTKSNLQRSGNEGLLSSASIQDLSSLTFDQLMDNTDNYSPIMNDTISNECDSKPITNQELSDDGKSQNETCSIEEEINTESIMSNNDEETSSDEEYEEEEVSDNDEDYEEVSTRKNKNKNNKINKNRRMNNKINKYNLFNMKKINTISILNVINKNNYSQNRKDQMKSTLNLIYKYFNDTLNIADQLNNKEFLFYFIMYAYEFVSHYMINNNNYSISHIRNIVQNVTNILDCIASFDQRVYWSQRSSSISKLLKSNQIRKLNIVYGKQRVQRSLELVQKEEGKCDQVFLY